MASIDPTLPADPYDLPRFLTAQNPTYTDALAELKAGQKRTHWMWFIFPQIEGLGTSATAKHYAIKTLDEARAHIRHPVLGQRLLECTRVVNRLQARSLMQIFGSPDHLKFCSSMTLFETVAEDHSEFTLALDKYCAGQRDIATLRLVQALK